MKQVLQISIIKLGMIALGLCVASMCISCTNTKVSNGIEVYDYYHQPWAVQDKSNSESFKDTEELRNSVMYKQYPNGIAVKCPVFDRIVYHY